MSKLYDLTSHTPIDINPRIWEIYSVYVGTASDNHSVVSQKRLISSPKASIRLKLQYDLIDIATKIHMMCTTN